MHTQSGKRREIGLGPVSAVSLAKARELSSEMRELVATGHDPRSALSIANVNAPDREVTFGEFAEEYITSVESGWRNPVHRQQWRSTIRDHASRLEGMPIKHIGTEAVLEVLRPIWSTIPETANRLRGRIEKILGAAKVRGLRSIDAINPAQWTGHLEFLLPKRKRLIRGHHAALEWQKAPDFMAELASRDATSARALEFTILTAARSGEVTGATWKEINYENRVWRIAAERMKGNREHIVPLSIAALATLDRVPVRKREPEMPLFTNNGRPLSNMAMATLLKRLKRLDITVHGFRSTFRDWAGDATPHPRELIEQALAHSISDKTEAAYRRGQAIEKRRILMEDWAKFLFG